VHQNALAGGKPNAPSFSGAYRYVGPASDHPEATIGGVPGEPSASWLQMSPEQRARWQAHMLAKQNITAFQRNALAGDDDGYASTSTSYAYPTEG
jgi:hypothetical protein